jgi:hypothetical protein
MRVVVHLSAFYDWQTVPADVKVTDADIKSGRVKPGQDGGWTMRVTRKHPSHTTVCIAESTLIGRAIFELIPRPGQRKLGACNRKQLVAELLDANVMPEHGHPKHFVGFDVDTDDGPDEKAFRAALAPYVEAKHHLTGEPLIDPADVEDIVKKYLEPATISDHLDYLHARFSVAKKVLS